MAVNSRQLIAYRSPATSPVALVNRRFSKDIRVGKLRLSAILTCSLIAGESTWHASISVLDRRYQPVPAGRISDNDFEIIRLELETLMEGVGDEAETSYMQSDSVFHMSRPLTTEEIDGLPNQAHAQNN